MDTKLTVIEVMQAEGIEPTRKRTLSAGLAARDLYKERTGALPPKELRKKTNPGSKGSHCIAVYPLSMRSALQRIVHQVSKAA